MTEEPVLLNLKAVKDWNIDLAAELESYLARIESQPLGDDEEGMSGSVDFIEAAMMIQGSSIVYSKKVEMLHDLAYLALRHVSLSETADDDDEEESSSRRRKRSTAVTLHAKLDAFEPLDDFFAEPTALEAPTGPLLLPMDETLGPRVPEALISFTKLVSDVYKRATVTNGITLPYFNLSTADDEYKLTHVHADLETGGLTLQQWTTDALQAAEGGAASQPMIPATPYRSQPQDVVGGVRPDYNRDDKDEAEDSSDDEGDRPRDTIDDIDTRPGWGAVDPYDPGPDAARPYRPARLLTIKAIKERLGRVGVEGLHIMRRAQVTSPASSGVGEDSGVGGGQTLALDVDMDDVGLGDDMEGGDLGMGMDDSDSEDDDHPGMDEPPPGPDPADIMVAEALDAPPPVDTGLDTLQERVERYWAQTRRFVEEDEVTKRVATWTTRIKEQLDAEAARPSFNAELTADRSRRCCSS